MGTHDIKHLNDFLYKNALFRLSLVTKCLELFPLSQKWICWICVGCLDARGDR